jgi:hypothetical protein
MDDQAMPVKSPSQGNLKTRALKKGAALAAPLSKRSYPLLHYQGTIYIIVKSVEAGSGSMIRAFPYHSTQVKPVCIVRYKISHI